MADSDLLEITELASTQSTRSVTVNEAIAKLESGAGLFPCVDVNLNTPPGGPVAGDVYVIGPSPTGVWAGHPYEIARYYNGSWRFMPPRSGLMAYAGNEDSYYRYKLAYGWETVIAGPGGGGVGTTQTGFISGFFKAEEDQTVPLIINSPDELTITATTTDAGSGSATYTFDIDGTPLGGSANAVSTSEQTQAHASANVLAVGANLNVTIANDSPAAERVAWLVKYTYELAP